VKVPELHEIHESLDSIYANLYHQLADWVSEGEKHRIQ